MKKLLDGNRVIHHQVLYTVYCLLYTVFCFLLAACQPQTVPVEVTRLVEVVAGEDSAVSAPTQVVEVTRLVPQEVTRVVTETVVLPVTPSPLGSAARPVQLLFPPVVNTAVLTTRSAPLVTALETATGLQFEVGVLDSETAVIDLMCAAPADTIGFLSAPGYVQANQQCGIQAANVAQHSDGLSWQAGMIVVRRDSNIQQLTDLAGKKWAVPDMNNIPEFLYFQALLAQQNIEVGEILPMNGDSSAILAVYNGEADFATATFTPPILPYAGRAWVYGVDDPEMWREFGISPSRSPIGYVVVYGDPENGGYRVRDARAGVFDTTRGIFNETTILSLTAPIPNETVVLGAQFPLELARQVIATLTTFAASESCNQSLCSSDFYGWMGLQPTEDSFYEPLRFVLQHGD